MGGVIVAMNDIFVKFCSFYPIDWHKIWHIRIPHGGWGDGSGDTCARTPSSSYKRVLLSRDLFITRFHCISIPQAGLEDAMTIHCSILTR